MAEVDQWNGLDGATPYGAAPYGDAVTSGTSGGEIMTLAEAATRIGLSRRRAQDLIARGQLQARRHRRAWLVSPKAVQFANRVLRHEAGHPLSQHGAWELISTEFESGACDPADHDVTRRRVRDRAQHYFDIAHPSTLVSLRADRRVVLSGRDAAAAHGAEVARGNPIDAYVRASDISGLRDQYHCDSNFEDANLLWHVVDDDAWPFAEGCRFVSAAVALLDLADQGDPGADILWRHVTGAEALG